MILKTENFSDMRRLISFVIKYDFIFEAGDVDSVYYSQGSVFIHPRNTIIDSLHNTMKQTNDDDSWVIVIEDK
jgi:hypothetical protein